MPENQFAIQTAFPDNAPMPHWIVESALISGRVAAGIFAAYAFYFAFFLYEDEEGRWQNRIENLWISIDDRSRHVQSRALAVFNAIGNLLRTAFSWTMGEKLFSARAVAVSANMSIGCALFFASVFGITFDAFRDIGVLQRGRSFSDICRALALFLFGLMPGYFKKAWASATSYLPLILCSLTLIFILLTGSKYFYWELPFVLAISVMCDFFSVAVLRRMFGKASNSPSIARIVVSVFVLTALSLALASAPLLGVAAAGVAFDGPPTPFQRAAPDLAILLELMNTATIIYCVLPLAVLMFLVLDKIIWPIISRGTYSLAKNKVVSNRKGLVSAGSLAATYAFKLGPVGWKDVLKVFGH